ncbi:hypothetical protein GCM10017771_94520 [Streptomyces capitiformicae]|uniref:Uncharacterized protein n=1 Tax=Streptomyces capitiformicae TaxID=2014920 RepID=A0A918ZUF3_9ACTN|nr:hypothetical protein GCM10017771_94520 [Streptomyces capitiformicae]
MLVEDIDVVGAQVPQEACLCDGADVFRSAVEGAAEAAHVGQVVAELGGQDNLVAEVLDRPPEQLLAGIAAQPVQFGGVAVSDAELESAADGGDPAIGVGRTVSHGHAHRAMAQR